MYGIRSIHKTRITLPAPIKKVTSALSRPRQNEALPPEDPAEAGGSVSGFSIWTPKMASVVPLVSHYNHQSRDVPRTQDEPPTCPRDQEDEWDVQYLDVQLS